MKKINYRLRRSIKSNLSYYVSIILLTMISTFLVAVAFSDAEMIRTDVSSLMAEGRVEDAQFQTIRPLEPTEIKELEDQYDSIIEESAYMDVTSGEQTLRIFRPMEKVDKYVLLEGENVKNDGEALLDRDFAAANQIQIGEDFTIDGVNLQVVGLAVRPDYLYSKKNQSDIWVDKENFGMLQVNGSTYKNLLQDKSWNESSYYTVIFNNEQLIKDFRLALNKDYAGYSYLSAQANSRIDVPRGAGDRILMESISLAPILFFVIMLLVAIVVGRMVEREKKYIGTLAALGYRRGELSLHYSLYAVLPGLIGSILGVLLSVVAGKGVAMYFVIDYQRINYDFYIRPNVLIICLVLPMILFGLVAYSKAFRLFKLNIVSMLREQAANDKKRRHMFEQSNISFRTKFRIRTLFGHAGRTLMVLFCIFLSTFLSAFGFSLKDSCNQLVKEGTNSASVYQYSYYLNQMQADQDYGGYKGIVVPFEIGDKGKMLSLSGVPEDSKFQNMKLMQGTYHSDGFYLTNVVAVEYGLKVNDELTIINSVTLEKTTVNIDGIIGDNAQQILYTSYNNVKDILGLKDNYFNVVYADEKLGIDGEKISYMGDSESILDTLMNALSALYSLIYGVMFVGSLLSIISIYLVVNLLIGENKSNISMFKVLGYRNKEINRLILRTNHILVPVGFALAIPAALAATKVLSVNMVPLLHVVLEPALRIESIIICLLIILCSYFLSLSLLRRKVDNIDMVVSLKGNRE